VPEKSRARHRPGGAKGQWLASNFFHILSFYASSRGVTRLERGKKHVWSPHQETWGLLEANVLYWRKYFGYFWDFSASTQSFGANPQSFGVPIVFQLPGHCAPIPPLYRPLASKGCVPNQLLLLAQSQNNWVPPNFGAGYATDHRYFTDRDL